MRSRRAKSQTRLSIGLYWSWIGSRARARGQTRRNDDLGGHDDDLADQGQRERDRGRSRGRFSYSGEQRERYLQRVQFGLYDESRRAFRDGVGSTVDGQATSRLMAHQDEHVRPQLRPQSQKPRFRVLLEAE